MMRFTDKVNKKRHYKKIIIQRLYDPQKNINFVTQLRHNGAVLEWLKRHAWKACKRQKRFPSSNLGRSAVKTLTDRHNKCRLPAFII